MSLGFMILYPRNCSHVIFEISIVTCAWATGTATSASTRPQAASMRFDIVQLSRFDSALALTPYRRLQGYQGGAADRAHRHGPDAPCPLPRALILAAWAKIAWH